jgi:hypothetical protein
MSGSLAAGNAQEQEKTGIIKGDYIPQTLTFSKPTICHFNALIFQYGATVGFLNY